MKPYYDRAGIVIYNGDCRAVLAGLPDGSVQTCITSPPYWGLRDYGTGAWEGGDAACDHLVRENHKPESSTLTGSTATVHHAKQGFRDLCPRCGARRVDSQIGLEASPAAYVAEMVAVFREVRRVLRDDGTVFLNLGDSFGAGKQLQMIPARVALALQADGWILRSDIIWAKPNPMPESVTDRPTRSHEYIFLLTKSATYYYDQMAIREPGSESGWQRQRERGVNTWDYGRDGYNDSRVGGMSGKETIDAIGRNKRDVFTIATKPLSTAHFATFPPKLIEPCILAGCPVGGVVLDPFAGAGTSLLVAKNHGRRSVGIELSQTYCGLIVNRLRQDVLDLGVA